MPFSRVTARMAAEESRLKRREAIERKQQRESNRPMLLPDTSFVAAFRLSKHQFNILCQDVILLMARSRRTSAVRPEMKILATLHFFASGGYQGHLGSARTLCLAQSIVSECIAEVTNILNKPQILRKYVCFPRSDTARRAVSQRFYEKEMRREGAKEKLKNQHYFYVRKLLSVCWEAKTYCSYH